MNQGLRLLLFALIVKPFTTIMLGMNVRGAPYLPRGGPAILVANHNSHLDTVILFALFPWKLLRLLRPVAAADYFLRNRWLAWFARRVVGIIAMDRAGGRRGRSHPLAPCLEALDRGEILILFPEGTRGEPETRTAFKSGVSHLAASRPGVPVVPIYLHGLGKALPRGEALLVPMICDVVVGAPVAWPGNRQSFMRTLEDLFTSMSASLHPPPDDGEAENSEEIHDATL